ncbi:MAG: hypothetical protein GTO14_02215 [Anaerolineales bacterium]|nr:hypothetical protein [Anaerolineales bacterium]
MRRSDWILFAFAVLLGIAGGVYYAWVVNPVEYVETAPASLREDYKSDQLTLIALAYSSTGDLERARARLVIIHDPDHASTLSQLAQTRLAAGFPEKEARALAMLAAALGERPTPPASTPSQPTGPSTSRIASTPSPTITRRPPPTRTPTATPGAPFELVEKEKVCAPELTTALIQVEVLDAAGQPVPGVEALVVWDDGQDHFFTGLKPELGIGYGDFTMLEGVYYTIQLVDSEMPVTGLIVEDCVGDGGELFPGSWLLIFQQPTSP